MEEFKIRGEYIDLLQFIKATGNASTGGEAAYLVLEGLVKVNDEVESRKRRKLRAGDCVELQGKRFQLS